MIKITAMPNPNSENGVCYEIKKRIDCGSGENPVTFFWYRVEDSIHMDFAHPQGMTDFKVVNSDEEFYEVIDGLYKMLLFADGIGVLNGEGTKSIFTFVSENVKNATPNRFSIEECEDGYNLHFNEFSSTQEGFTEIIMNADSAQKRILSMAFETFEKLYSKRETKQPCFIKK